MLLNIAIEQMLNDSEPELGVAVQLMGIIKILLEPDNMLTEKGDFLNFFYKHSIQTLIGRLLCLLCRILNLIKFASCSTTVAQYHWRSSTK